MVMFQNVQKAVSATAANENFAMVEFKDGFETSEDDTAVAVGLKKGSELTEKINEILAGISEEERKKLWMRQLKINQLAE